MNNNLDTFYLVIMCVILASGSVDFFKEEQIAWTIIGGISSILFLLSAIGAYKNIKPFLWLAIICVISYIVYGIGVIIWMLFFDSLTSFPQLLFILFVVAIISLINIKVAFKLKERLHYNIE